MLLAGCYLCDICNFFFSHVDLPQLCKHAQLHSAQSDSTFKYYMDAERQLNGRNRLRRSQGGSIKGEGRQKEKIRKKKTSRIVFSVGLLTVSGQGMCHAQFYYLHTGTNNPTEENSSIKLHQNMSFEKIEMSSSIFQVALSVQVLPSSPSHWVENKIACLQDTKGNHCCVSFNKFTQIYSRLNVWA